MSARRELTAEEVKDALTRLADGIMLDPINRIELRAIAVMLMNDADAVATARYQPTEEAATKIQRLGDEVVSLRIELANANVKAEGRASHTDVVRWQDQADALEQVLDERKRAALRIGVVMRTMRTHFRHAENRRREVVALLAEGGVDGA